MDKRSHLVSLIKLAETDGYVSPIEIMFIKGLSLRMGVSHDEFNEILQQRDSIPFRVPLKKEEQFRQLAELVILMNVDLENKPEEIAIINDIAGKMGISSDKVAEIVEYLSKNKLTEESIESFMAL